MRGKAGQVGTKQGQLGCQGQRRIRKKNEIRENVKRAKKKKIHRLE